jgi:hypothetical protein
MYAAKRRGESRALHCGAISFEETRSLAFDVHHKERRAVRH